MKTSTFLRSSRIILFIWLGISLFSPSYSQVGINTDNPDSSTVLHLAGTDRGFLITRLSPTQRRSITTRFQNPANGLLVFDRSHKLFYYFDASTTTDDETNGRWTALNPWTMRGSYQGRNDSAVFFTGRGNVGIGTDLPLSKLSIIGNLSVGSSYETSAAPGNGMIVQGTVGIGTDAPEAKLHVASTGAMIIPAGTTNQRPDLESPGGMRYNTNSGNVEVNNGDIWKVLIPTGTILPFAGQTVPDGWLLCDGSAINRTTYGELFRAIGTAWGAGDGGSTFHIPDLRGMFLRGVDHNSSRDPERDNRTANAPGGNTGNNVGTIQQDAVGSHDHPINDPGHSHGYVDEWGRPEISDNADDRWVGSDSRDPHDKTTSINTTGIAVLPNSGRETRPINANVNYIIKY